MLKDNYNIQFSFRCDTCGDTSSFEFNEDKSWVKCVSCNREYNGGIEELKELNKEEINQEIENVKKEVTEDLKAEFQKIIRDAFKK